MDYRKYLETRKAEYNLLVSNREQAAREVEQHETEVNDIESAQVAIQIIAKSTQSQVKVHIEDLVTRALEAVFPDPYTFCVDFEMKRNKTEAKLLFERGGNKVDPMDSTGGGAVDIAAFALRIALWAIGKSSPTLIFDEPFRFLSSGYQSKAGELLKELSRLLGVQFIIVTHNVNLEESADNLIVIDMENKESYVRNARRIQGR